MHRWVNLCRSHRARTLQADVRTHNHGSANYLAEACIFLPQSEATYAMCGYNREPRKGPPTFRTPFSVAQQTDVDSPTSKVHAPNTQRSALWGIHLHVSNTQALRTLNCQQTITASIRFPWNSFKYFSPSFQSSFHLSFTLLLRYRSPRNI